MGSQRVSRDWVTKHSTESHQQNKLFFFFFFTTAQGVASETTHSLSSISSSKMWISHCESVTHKLHWDNRMVFSLLIWWLWEIGSDCLEHCCKEFKLSRRKHQELWVRPLVSTRWGKNVQHFGHTWWSPISQTYLIIKEELKSWLKTQHSKNEDHGILSHHFMAPCHITSWQIDDGTMAIVTDFFFLGSKITAYGELQLWN